MYYPHHAMFVKSNVIYIYIYTIHSFILWIIMDGTHPIHTYMHTAHMHQTESFGLGQGVVFSAPTTVFLVNCG